MGGKMAGHACRACGFVSLFFGIAISEFRSKIGRFLQLRPDNLFKASFATLRGDFMGRVKRNNQKKSNNGAGLRFKQKLWRPRLA